MRPTFPLLFTAALLCHPFAARAEAGKGACLAAVPVGGPPSIRIAEKAKGDITRAQWATTTAVKLAGCVPDARVVTMKLCINDCKGKQSALTATDGTFTKAMKQMIDNLPNGTPFTVEVEVKDRQGKLWEVPDAVFAIVR